MAVEEPGEHRSGQELIEVGVGQVLDVVVLGDHVTVVIGVVTVDEAVQLQNNRALLRTGVEVFPGFFDQFQGASRRLMEKVAVVLAVGHVDHEVVGLAALVERLFQ